MIFGLTVGVVIPCYRAARTVGDVLSKIPPFVDWVIVVDDACPDGTLRALDSLSSELQTRLVVIRHDRNQGVAGALSTGYEEALRRGLEIVVKLDGDGQMDPSQIIDLVKPIASGRYDYTKGTRFHDRGSLNAMPWLRRIGSVALAYCTRFISGYSHISDPQNGFLAISRSLLSRIDLRRLRVRRYFFENEMLIQLNVLGARVTEVPMAARYGREISSLRISSVALYFPYFFLLGLYFRAAPRFHRTSVAKNPK